jgi:D-xylose reductase
MYTYIHTYIHAYIHTYIGEGLKRALEEGLVLRKDLFIVSKLWNTYHRKEHVRDACLRSLQDLQVP